MREIVLETSNEHDALGNASIGHPLPFQNALFSLVLELRRSVFRREMAMVVT
jgi:hypothetical protein